MPHPLTYDAVKGAKIVGARLVGAKQREAAMAAGVPFATVKLWLSKGRAYNAAPVAEREPAHAVLGAFAADYDKAEEIGRAHV